MASINKAIIIGRLGKDPQINTFTNGSKIASFTVATSETWNDKTTGERKERTEWHNIVINNPALVTLAETYLKKGSQAYIEGTIRTREYTDQNGLKRYVTEIVVAPFGGQIMLLDSKPTQSAPAADYTPQASGWTPDDDMGDDIPF
jgi:single-strand DNA-binding protein